MRRSRFSVEQIVAVLKQAELGMAVPELIRKVGISEQTFYRWKKQYAGLQPDRNSPTSTVHGGHLDQTSTRCRSSSKATRHF